MVIVAGAGGAGAGGAGAGTDAGVDVIGSGVFFPDWQPETNAQPKTAATTRTGSFGFIQKECQNNAGRQLQILVARAKTNSPAGCALTPPAWRRAKFSR